MRAPGAGAGAGTGTGRSLPHCRNETAWGPLARERESRRCRRRPPLRCSSGRPVGRPVVRPGGLVPEQAPARTAGMAARAAESRVGAAAAPPQCPPPGTAAPTHHHPCLSPLVLPQRLLRRRHRPPAACRPAAVPPRRANTQGRPPTSRAVARIWIQIRIPVKQRGPAAAARAQAAARRLGLREGGDPAGFVRQSGHITRGRAPMAL
jgi:hypothetical protein